MSNVLLNLADEPRYDEITTADIKPAMQAAIAEARDAIAGVKAQADITWGNTVEQLTDITERVGRIWGVVAHLNSVADTPPLRAVYNELMPEVTVFFTEIGQDMALYERFKAIKNSAAFDKLDAAQQTKLQHDLRDFVLSGAELPPEAQAEFAALQTEGAQLAAQFSQNVLDATDAFALYFDDADELAGLTEEALAMFAAAAAAEGKSGYKIGLQMPHYIAVMQYADKRELREKLYHAYVTRASELSDEGKFDNTANINRRLEVALREAQLLGYRNFAELSLATKMAHSTEQVLAFLGDLAARSRPQAQADLAELQAYAQAEYGVSELAAWDIAYYSEKLKQHRYAISNEALRPYFPEQKVVQGLFDVVKRIFGIRIKPHLAVETWHPDVRFYDIIDADGELRGSFYLDLYARAHKRGGAWMDDCMGRRYRRDGQLQHPVAYLTCNFNGPVDGKPALFTHDEVVTLFHEFGHGLHHMLTQIDVAGVAGINGVPWDAVELPSQFLENWCWEPEALAVISGHYETGEALPQSELDKLLAAKNFQSAMQMLRQLEFALFDFRLHREYDPQQGGRVQQILDDVRSQTAVLVPPAFNRFQHSFSHIFGGGYAAGYYSYKWAEVLSADAFSRFEEEGIFNPQTGRDFLQYILEKGGSDEPMTLFKAFRGREPRIDALLRHSGIQ